MKHFRVGQRVRLTDYGMGTVEAFNPEHQLSVRVLREIMLQTGGELFLAGGSYDITQKHLGAGIYSVSTIERKG